MLDLFVVPTLVATLVLVVGLIGWWLAVEWAFRPRGSEKQAVSQSSGEPAPAEAKAITGGEQKGITSQPKGKFNQPTSLPPTNLANRRRSEEQATAAADLGLKRTAEKIAAPSAHLQAVAGKHQAEQKQNPKHQTASKPTRNTEKPSSSGHAAHNAGTSKGNQATTQNQKAKAVAKHQASAKHQSHALKSNKQVNQKLANHDRSTTTNANANANTNANAAVAATRKETRSTTTTAANQKLTQSAVNARVPELAATTDLEAPQRPQQHKAATVTQKPGASDISPNASDVKNNNKNQQKQKYQTAAKSNRAFIRHEASLQITAPSTRPSTDKASTQPQETAKKEDSAEKLNNQATNKVNQANAATSPGITKPEARKAHTDGLNAASGSNTTTSKSTIGQSNTATALTEKNSTNQGNTAAPRSDHNPTNQNNATATATNKNSTSTYNPATTTANKNSKNQSNVANTLTNKKPTDHGNAASSATDNNPARQGATADKNLHRQSNTAIAPKDKNTSSQSNAPQNATQNSAEENTTNNSAQNSGTTNVHALSDANQRKNLSLVNINTVDQNASSNTRKQSAIELALARKEATALTEPSKQHTGGQTSTDSLNRAPAAPSAPDESSQLADPDLRAELELSKKRIASLQSALNNAQQNQQAPIMSDTPASASKSPVRATLLSKVRVLDSTRV